MRQINPTEHHRTARQSDIGQLPARRHRNGLAQREPAHITAQRAHRIRIQSFNLIDELTVAENIELPLTYLGVPKKERRIKVDNLLQRLNLSHRSRHYPQQLSGGQQQRVAIARAIVGDPVILLADEPTGNLDSSNGREVMELLTSLNREGTTIVMVTHSQRDASYARRTINLFDGSVVTDETAERDTVNDDRHEM